METKLKCTNFNHVNVTFGFTCARLQTVFKLEHESHVAFYFWPFKLSRFKSDISHSMYQGDNGLLRLK